MWAAPFWSLCTAKGPLDLHSLGCPWCWLGGRSATTKVCPTWTPTTSAGRAWPSVSALSYGRGAVATVAGQDPVHVVLETELVIRESA
jgi:hypothetical protein